MANGAETRGADEPASLPNEPSKPLESEPAWTFLTNHSHVLICLAQEPEARMRDVAAQVGITERAVQRIIADLERAGYIERRRDGRRNHYEIRRHLPLRHPVERHQPIAALIALARKPPSR